MVTDMHALIESCDVSYAFSIDNFIIHVPDFRIDKGELLFIQGMSDFARTAFMYRILGAQELAGGSILFKGINPFMLKFKELLRYRRSIGYVPSQLGLLKNLTVLENIMLPLQIKGSISEDAALEHVELIYRLCNITVSPFHEAWGLPKLEEKKILIARAIASDPELILIDDPTSYLEKNDKNTVISLIENVILEMYMATGKSGIIVTTEEDEWVQKGSGYSIELAGDYDER